MSPLLPLGVGMQLGGSVLSGFGEAQGLKSMAGEADRQGAEWDSENKNQQQMMAAEIARRRMALDQDSASPALARRQGALAGAGALSTGLGLNSADRARVNSALIPMSTVVAQGQGQQQQAQQNQIGMNRMGTNIQQSQRDQADRARMYDQLMHQAGQSGAGMRQAGELLQQGGGIASTFGMMTPNAGTVAPANATYESTGQSIFPMRTTR